MGSASSHHHYIPVLPSESLNLCPGIRGTCFCISPHPGMSRWRFCEPGGRRRYLDPGQYIERLTVNGDFYVGDGAGYGGYGGLGWRDRGQWGPRDYDRINEFLDDYFSRRDRAVSRRRGGHGDSEDDEDPPRRRGRDRELLNYLDAAERRLHNVERAALGTEAEQRDAAFRERINRVLGDGGGGVGDNPYHRGGMDAASRLLQQQRDAERRRVEMRERIRREDELLREARRLQRERDYPGPLGGGGPFRGWGDPWQPF